MRFLVFPLLNDWLPPDHVRFSVCTLKVKMPQTKPFWWVKGAEILDIFCDHMDNPLNAILLSCWEVTALLFSEIKLLHLEETSHRHVGWGPLPLLTLQMQHASTSESHRCHLLLLRYLVSISHRGQLSLDSLIQWPTRRGSYCKWKEGRGDKRPSEQDLKGWADHCPTWTNVAVAKVRMMNWFRTNTCIYYVTFHVLFFF